MLKKLTVCFFTFIAVSLIASISAYGQEIQIERMITIEPEDIQEICVLDPLDYDDHFRFNPAPNRFKANANGSGATFEINYRNDCGGEVWPDEAIEAFDYATELWGSHLSSDVPISINATWRSLGSNTLGSAGPSTLFALTGGDIFPNTFYPIAQVNALLGRDVKEQDNVSVTSDINVNISCDRTDWYFGTDANPPSGQYDLVTVLLHEIGHGIGFLGTVFGNNSSQTADWGIPVEIEEDVFELFPFVYDQFTLDGNFDNLIDTDVYPLSQGNRTSEELYDAVTGRVGGVFFSGLDAEFSLENVRVPLWAPVPYQAGSSYSHLDQGFFSTNGQFGSSALMRPAIPTQLAIHSPGPVFCGMLKDMLWPLGPACELLIEDTGPLERPLLAMPGNGVKGQNRIPQLVWNDVSGAGSYQVQLSRDFLHTNKILDKTVNGTSLTVDSPLNNSTLYFWRVRAIGPAGTSNWSGTFRFTTQLGLPNQVTLISPQDEFINIRPGFEFRWEDAPGVENYELQVSESPDFTNRVIEETLSQNRYSETQNLDFSTTFYWRVRASNSTGTTDWSEVWSFTTIIEKPEPVTVNVLPADNQNQIPLLADFIWEPSARASDYTVQISKNENFSTLPISGAVQSPQYSNVIPLEPAQVYFWRVQASNIGGVSGWSETFTFTSVVDETKINDNFPNPFNTATNLRYQLSNQTNVLIDLYDIGGRRVAILVDGEQAPGVYLESLQAYSFASGTYLLRFVADGVMDVQKMTIIK
tara:strand:+ start:28827 stop:31091 length:2265 start_codon:yes stop_codon:yes gene_type:complete